MRIKIYILGHSISLHTGTATSIKTVAVGQTVMRSRQSFPHITGRDFTAMVKIVGSRLRELGRSSQSDRWPASRAVAAIKHEDYIQHMTYTLENAYKMNVTGLSNM